MFTFVPNSRTPAAMALLDSWDIPTVVSFGCFVMKSLRFNMTSCLYRGPRVVLDLGGWENCARQLMAAHPLPPRDVDGLRKTNARADPMAKPPSLLTAVFGEDIEIKEERPRVTLTFAQSLDAKIAGIDGKQLILSGKESMVMTHW